MKIQRIGSFLVIAFCALITSCETYYPKNSDLGHGYFRCYYQNMTTGQLYEGIGDTEQKGGHLAKSVCEGVVMPGMYKVPCEFADCVFK